MTASIIAAALAYAARGWQVIPLGPNSKRPLGDNWQDQRLTAADIPARFAHGENIGVLLGAISGGLTDIDLDCPQARALAAAFLPETRAIFGRSSTPKSHWLYVVADPIAYAKYDEKDADKTTLIELRTGTKESAHQTVFPPSVHPKGETLAWDSAGEPTAVTAAVLVKAVRTLAAATILARHWPGEGSRNEAALALAGGLLHGGWAEADAASFIHNIASAAGDPEDRGGAAKSTAEKVRRGENTTGWPRLMTMMSADAIIKALEWLGLNEPDPEKKGKRPNVTAQLIALTAKNELFYDEGDNAYMTAAVDGHEETYSLVSAKFKDWFIGEYYEAYHIAPPAPKIAEALGTLRAMALRGELREVHLRTGMFRGKIYIDLGDPAWRVVEIDTVGWHLVQAPGIKFRRVAGLGILPVPEPGGSLAELRPFLNMQDDAQFALALGSLVAGVWPTGPYPITMVHGEAGSAKSSVVKLFQYLIDPSQASVRMSPETIEDLMVAAHNSHLLAFDNVSYIKPSISDAYCAVATGVGFGTRKFYVNDEQVILKVARPLFINGIVEVAGRRGDLMDRSLVLQLQQIEDKDRRTEAELAAAWAVVYPRILGALYTAVSASLRNWASVVLVEKPRMIDMAVRVIGAEEAFPLPPGTFLAALLENRAANDAASMESSLITDPLYKLLAKDGHFGGTMAQLLMDLTAVAGVAATRQKAWPADAARLGGQLRRARGQFRRLGILLTFTRSNGVSRISITAERKVEPTVAAVEPAVAYERKY